jgi:cobalt/nickel transport system permease protein
MLLVRGHERGERVGQAMRCRAFDGTFRSLTEFRTTLADIVSFALVSAYCSCLVAWEIFQRRAA